ncbi:MAG: hypothetical protein A3A82_00635 [Candidatus Pacebacteria bacterium RIFCSPLOWO2_01_FULL_47_12]|nr:MAG: hypothetical protein A3J60_02375 [Candidatus Pacebacteria bacterium RIFCSPHIGHO2_02_FULL_46_9]OGJ38595.1 MAG: hypothetical protein A3A82_00635 [Candidatus Pacebacteria bacterium RIFCSPLOWO2_01_FULL_47_12]
MLIRPAPIIQKLQKNLSVQALLITLLLLAIIGVYLRSQSEVFREQVAPANIVAQSQEKHLPIQYISVVPGSKPNTFELYLDTENPSVAIGFSLKVLVEAPVLDSESRIVLSQDLLDLGWTPVVSTTTTQEQMLTAELAAITVAPGGLPLGPSRTLARLLLTGSQGLEPRFSLDTTVSSIVYQDGTAYSLAISNRSE